MIFFTQPAPGHDGPRVSGGDALQDSGLVNVQSEILRPRENHRLLIETISCD